MMLPDEDIAKMNTVQEIYRVTLENNEMLKGLRRHQRVSTVFTFLYWALILASLAGAYIYVKPFMQTILGNTEKAQSFMLQLEALRGQIPDSKLLEQLLNSFKAK